MSCAHLILAFPRHTLHAFHACFTCASSAALSRSNAGSAAEACLRLRKVSRDERRVDLGHLPSLPPPCSVLLNNTQTETHTHTLSHAMNVTETLARAHTQTHTERDTRLHTHTHTDIHTQSAIHMNHAHDARTQKTKNTYQASSEFSTSKPQLPLSQDQPGSAVSSLSPSQSSCQVWTRLSLRAPPL